ncbi:MBL fold metallo-hydrolase [Paraclostridium bifermentans]|uniref:MBL fold metallo-hydrolase n=1 Tax=Paraclostridium bifermentans TaxID=1490 RepID=UPI001FF2D3CC|nr:MBL fold metallo-hydrolase [Paraclostridium bifermentans]UOW69158.1 MBL fold metallo-hydrolase [Paraclostridium bifermentans]
MKLKIIGSGGCVALPKPLCKCRICKEARLKGNPYSRYGCSLFIEDLGMLIDTPEDITQAINFSEIDEINYVLYSHVDPDHTLGMRVFEHIRLNWLEISKGKECTNPVNVLAMEHVMEDINSIKFKFGSYLDYYENVRKLIRRKPIESSIIIDGIKISFLKVNHATVFVFEKDNKKVIYAPCDVKPFPNDIIFERADLLIIGNTVVGDELKDGFILGADNPLRKELFTLDEIQNLKNNYSIKNVIITHLEEDWGKSYDDYIKLEKQYKNIKFAYDGMKIEI